MRSISQLRKLIETRIKTALPENDEKSTNLSLRELILIEGAITENINSIKRQLAKNPDSYLAPLLSELQSLLPKIRHLASFKQ